MDGDRQFLLSVFLMEAWDTLAAVEDGLAALRHSPDPTAVIEHLAVVTHRLRGSAALSGFPQVAGLATAMEEAVERVAATPPGADRRSLGALGDMVFWLKTALDVIGETGVEDAEAIAESLAGLAPSTPPGPADETTRRLAELDRFFTDQRGRPRVLRPRGGRASRGLAQSLVALEGEGSTESEVASLFRAVHTLKGAAYTVGCGMIGDLAHRVEDMLGEIREHQRPLDRAAIETVFAGLDALRLLVRSGEDRAETRAAVYERAMALLDALPARGCPGWRWSPRRRSERLWSRSPSATGAVAASPRAAPEVPHYLEPVAAAEAVAPAAERVTRGQARSRASRDAAARRVRPSIRVSLDRLDALMNLVGELVITRSRLERHLGQLEQAGELLSFTQSRMTQTVAEFESKYADRLVPPVRPHGGGSRRARRVAPGRVLRRARVRSLRRLQPSRAPGRRDLERPHRDPARADRARARRPGGRRRRAAPERRAARPDHSRPHGPRRPALRAVRADGPGRLARGRQERRRSRCAARPSRWTPPSSS